MANLWILNRFIKGNKSCITDAIVTKLMCTSVCIHNHWLGAYRTNALYSGHIFVRFNDLKDVFT